MALRGNFKGLGQQGVASQHRDAVAKNLVVRGLSPPKIVVVHGRKIVMDE